jgi:hypothetical protein
VLIQIDVAHVNAAYVEWHSAAKDTAQSSSWFLDDLDAGFIAVDYAALDASMHSSSSTAMTSGTAQSAKWSMEEAATVNMNCRVSTLGLQVAVSADLSLQARPSKLCCLPKWPLSQRNLR